MTEPLISSAASKVASVVALIASMLSKEAVSPPERIAVVPRVISPPDTVRSPSSWISPVEPMVTTSVAPLLNVKLFVPASLSIVHVSAASSPSSASRTITASVPSAPWTSRRASGLPVPMPTRCVPA